VVRAGAGYKCFEVLEKACPGWSFGVVKVMDGLVGYNKCHL
jgi:hypothetical protein